MTPPPPNHSGHGGHPKQILDIYRILCSGKDHPYAELCNLFDQQTNHGSDMKAYDTHQTSLRCEEQAR